MVNKEVLGTETGIFPGLHMRPSEERKNSQSRFFKMPSSERYSKRKRLLQAIWKLATLWPIMNAMSILKICAVEVLNSIGGGQNDYPLSSMIPKYLAFVRSTSSADETHHHPTIKYFKESQTGTFYLTMHVQKVWTGYLLARVLSIGISENTPVT